MRNYLFVNHKLYFSAEEQRILYFQRLKLKAFDFLKKNWQIENFKTKKNSELAQMVLYQWSVFVKLNKIQNRYHNS